MRVTFLEVPYPPRVGGEDFFLQDSAEFLFPAAFQFDEVLNLLIRAELCRLIEAARRPCILFREHARGGERSFAIHLQVDRNERKCCREVPQRKHCCGH